MRGQLPLMFWLMVGSTMMGYGVVQTFQNTASSMLLERNLFKSAQPIVDCCCWADGSAKDCYAQWPDPQDEHREYVPTPGACRC